MKAKLEITGHEYKDEGLIIQRNQQDYTPI
jgi:hypothetical protein